jgi:hypothetical protein
MEEAIGRLKAGDQELLDALLDIACQERRQHGLSCTISTLQLYLVVGFVLREFVVAQ